MHTRVSRDLWVCGQKITYRGWVAKWLASTDSKQKLVGSNPDVAKKLKEVKGCDGICK